MSTVTVFNVTKRDLGQEFEELFRKHSHLVSCQGLFLFSAALQGRIPLAIR